MSILKRKVTVSLLALAMVASMASVQAADPVTHRASGTKGRGYFKTPQTSKEGLTKLGGKRGHGRLRKGAPSTKGYVAKTKATSVPKPSPDAAENLSNFGQLPVGLAEEEEAVTSKSTLNSLTRVCQQYVQAFNVWDKATGDQAKEAANDKILIKGNVVLKFIRQALSEGTPAANIIAVCDMAGVRAVIPAEGSVRISAKAAVSEAAQNASNMGELSSGLLEEGAPSDPKAKMLNALKKAYAKYKAAPYPASKENKAYQNIKKNAMNMGIAAAEINQVQASYTTALHSITPPPSGAKSRSTAEAAVSEAAQNASNMGELSSGLLEEGAPSDPKAKMLNALKKAYAKYKAAPYPASKENKAYQNIKNNAINMGISLAEINQVQASYTTALHSITPPPSGAKSRSTAEKDWQQFDAQDWQPFTSAPQQQSADILNPEALNNLGNNGSNNQPAAGSQNNAGQDFLSGMASEAGKNAAAKENVAVLLRRLGNANYESHMAVSGSSAETMADQEVETLKQEAITAGATNVQVNNAINESRKAALDAVARQQSGLHFSDSPSKLKRD